MWQLQQNKKRVREITSGAEPEPARAAEAAATDIPRSGSSPAPGRQSRKASPPGTETRPQTHAPSGRKADPSGAQAPTLPHAAKRRRGGATPPAAAEGGPRRAAAAAAGDTPRSGSSPVPGRQSHQAGPPRTETRPQTHADDGRKADSVGTHAPARPLAAKRRQGASPPPPAKDPRPRPAAAPPFHPDTRTSRRGPDEEAEAQPPAAKRRSGAAAAAADDGPSPPPVRPEKPRGSATYGPAADRSGVEPAPEPEPRSGIG